MLHEFCLTARIKGWFQKQVAKESKWPGCLLNLSLHQLPTSSQMDLVRAALKDLEDCPRIPTDLPRVVGQALENIYSALIVPSLFERAVHFDLVKEAFSTNDTLERALHRHLVERQSMFNSRDRAVVVQAHLELAAFQLDSGMFWTNYLYYDKGTTEKDLARNLKDAIRNILIARENMPVLDIEGW